MNMANSTLPDECTFWLRPGEQCGRAPIQGDYVDVDDVTGEKLITSNCARHDGPAARREAMARGITRRDRRPALEAVSA